VVVTAEEIISIVDKKGAARAASDIDVVTTGTFAPMCSSGVFLNIKHSTPRIKIQNAWLNGVPAYGGIAAMDLYLGATAVPEADPLNKVFPGKFPYGGGHVIEDLLRGKSVELTAEGYGTQCYPGRNFNASVSLSDLNNAMLVNPRNGYQNYNVAVNAFSKDPVYTYLGILLPNLGNAYFCSAGQLSPLLNDPYFRTIGSGTRIFLGGGTGIVFSEGTQHAYDVKRGSNGVPAEGAGTLAVSGDLKQMSPDYIRGVSVTGYGVSLAVGIGIPIPILDENMVRCTAVRDSEIKAPVIDYSQYYPENHGEPLCSVSYAELRSGTISVKGKMVKTAAVSSYSRARKIAEILKNWIRDDGFQISRPVEFMPGAQC